MNYEKLEPIEGGFGGCGHCGHQYDVLPLSSIIAVGMGCAALTMDGGEIYSEPNKTRRKNYGSTSTGTTNIVY